MVKTLKEGVTNPNSLEFLEDNVLATFTNGDAAFGLNWTYMYGGATDASKSKVVERRRGGPHPRLRQGRQRNGERRAAAVHLRGKQARRRPRGSTSCTWRARTSRGSTATNAVPIWKSLYADQASSTATPWS